MSTKPVAPPTIRVPSTSPPLSPPSKLAVRYRPTPLPSPESRTSNSLEQTLSHSSTSTTTSDGDGRPATPIDPTTLAAEDDPSRGSGSPGSRSLPSLAAITTTATSSTSPRDAFVSHRTDSYVSQLSTSSSFSSGGSPLVATGFAPAPSPPRQEKLERPTVQQRQRSYSNRMAEAALVALEQLIVGKREEEGEGEVERERRERGLKGEGVKSVWREVAVGVWQ